MIGVRENPTMRIRATILALIIPPNLFIAFILLYKQILICISSCNGRAKKTGDDTSN